MDFQQNQFGPPFMGGNEFGPQPMGQMPIENSPLISPTPHFSQPSGFSIQQPQAQLFNNFQEPNYFPTNQPSSTTMNDHNPFNSKKEHNREHDLEDYLHHLRGTVIKVFMTFNGSSDWNDRIFEGVLESIGEDFITINNHKHHRSSILPIKHLDWIEVETSSFR